MITKQYYKIYSIQTDLNQSGLIEIETRSLRGLYRFSILGINQKHSSDIKDRIYSALRSQRLINLKSDNKKITVNLLPTDIDKKTNIYDLGIALSCLCCMDQIEFCDDVIVIGELSILGNIIHTGYLLKSIYQSIKNNIKTIICSHADIKNIDNYQNNLYSLIKENNINFIVGDNLNDLIQNIKDSRYYEFSNTHETIIDIQKSVNYNTNISDKNIFKIVLSLCTKRNIFIEIKKDSYIRRFLNNLIYYNRRIGDNELLTISNILIKNDKEVLHKYMYPIISILDNQTQKHDLNTMLSESLFGFNLIENFTTLSEENWYMIKKNSVSSILCFYNSCPCGNNNFFFNKNSDERCFCLQRNILKYRQRLYKAENGFFDFHIKNIEDINLSYGPTDYININNIIYLFRNVDVDILYDSKTDSVIDSYTCMYERIDLDEIINLAKDIKRLNYIINKKEGAVLSKKEIDLAIELIKKDF
jgi:hypothetical protein